MNKQMKGKEVEAFLTKNGLRLLGMFLSTQGKSLLRKKDPLTLRAIQVIFWKALKPLINFHQNKIKKTDERLQKKLKEFVFKSMIASDNLRDYLKFEDETQVNNQLFEIKNYAALQINENGQDHLQMELSPGVSAEKDQPRSLKGEIRDQKGLLISSELLTKVGKLNVLRIRLNQFLMHFANNRGRIKENCLWQGSSVKNMFCRQTKRKIDRLCQSLKKDNSFQGDTSCRGKAEACAICSIDECLEEDDIFVYCDSCSVMVHKKCLALDVALLNKQPWFCPNCLRSKTMKDNQTKLIDQLSKHSEFDLECGRKKKGKQDIKKVSQVINELFEMEEFGCVFCGKFGGVTVPIEGLPDFFGHVSCGVWLEDVELIHDFSLIKLRNPSVFGYRISSLNQSAVFSPHKKNYFTKGLSRIEETLKGFFRTSNFAKEVTLNQKLIQKFFKSPQIPFKDLLSKKKEKSFRKFKKHKKSFVKTNCMCLFRPLLQVNFWYIFRRIVNVYFNLNSNVENLNRIANIIVSFHPVFYGKYHRTRNPKGTCPTCHLPPLRKCKVCMQAFGLLANCSHENCQDCLHIECARRVFCEMIPQGLLSQSNLVFCPEHSKGSVFRRKETLDKKMDAKVLEIANMLRENQAKVLLMKKQMERDESLYLLEQILLTKRHRYGKNLNLLKKASKTENSLLNNKKTKRIRKNKFEKVIKEKQASLIAKLKNSCLNQNSYWFLQHKNSKNTKTKIKWNLKKKQQGKYQIERVIFSN